MAAANARALARCGGYLLLFSLVNITAKAYEEPTHENNAPQGPNRKSGNRNTTAIKLLAACCHCSDGAAQGNQKTNSCAKKESVPCHVALVHGAEHHRQLGKQEAEHAEDGYCGLVSDLVIGNEEDGDQHTAKDGCGGHESAAELLVTRSLLVFLDFATSQADALLKLGKELRKVAVALHKCSRFKPFMAASLQGEENGADVRSHLHWSIDQKPSSYTASCFQGLQ